MGIKQLMKVKNKNAKSNYEGQTLGEMGTKICFKDLEGERVGIDASFVIYESILAMQFVSSLTDADGKPTSHILTAFNKILKMKKTGMHQVWLFDSPKSNPLKANELKKRSQKREDSTNEKVQFQMSGEHVHDLQELLKHMGILYIVAPDGIEAEQYGAMLTMGDETERYCRYIISGDTDVLLFGGNLLKPISKRSKASTIEGDFMGYDLPMLLENFDLTRDKFVKMGLALGSDFAEKTPTLGPANVHVKARHNKIILTPEQEAAYNYFMQPVEMNEAHLVENEYNRENLLTFLESRGFKRERYEKRLDAAYAE